MGEGEVVGAGRSEMGLGGTAASHGAARRLQLKRVAELDGRLAPRLAVAGAITPNVRDYFMKITWCVIDYYISL